MDQSELWEQEDAIAFRRKLMGLQAEVNLAEEAERRAKGEYGMAARRHREAQLHLRKLLEDSLRPLPLFDRKTTREEPVAPSAAQAPLPAPAPVEPPEARCVCCLGLASHLERGQGFDAQGLCPDCVGAVRLGEADTGQGQLTVWSLPCGTAWAHGPFRQLGNWSRADLRSDQYAPSTEQIAEAVGTLAGRALTCADWWPLDSLGLMVIRLAAAAPMPFHEGAVCWLPEVVPGPERHVSPEALQLARQQLLALPSWWGRSEDLTAQNERLMVQHRLRGIPQAPHDQVLLEQVTAWRQRQSAGDVAAEWKRWSEFSVHLADGQEVRALYQPTSLGDLLDLHGPVSPTGFHSCHVFVKPAEGESLTEYARRTAQALHDEWQSGGKKKKGKRKAVKS